MTLDPNNSDRVPGMYCDDPYDQRSASYHEVAKEFPPLLSRDYDTLKEDIRKNGQQTPILTYQDKIIDGRARDRACRELGLKPRSMEWDGSSSLQELLWSLNRHRRPLTRAQCELLANLLQPSLAKTPTKERPIGKAPRNPDKRKEEGRKAASPKSARNSASTKKEKTARRSSKPSSSPKNKKKE